MVFKFSSNNLNKSLNEYKDFEICYLERNNILQDLISITELNFCSVPNKNLTLNDLFSEGRIIVAIEYGFILSIINGNVALLSTGWNTTKDDINLLIASEIELNNSIRPDGTTLEWSKSQQDITEKTIDERYGVAEINKNIIAPVFMKLGGRFRTLNVNNYSNDITLGIEIQLFISRTGIIKYTRPDLFSKEEILDIVFDAIKYIYKNEIRTSITEYNGE